MYAQMCNIIKCESISPLHCIESGMRGCNQRPLLHVGNKPFQVSSVVHGFSTCPFNSIEELQELAQHTLYFEYLTTLLA